MRACRASGRRNAVRDATRVVILASTKRTRKRTAKRMAEERKTARLEALHRRKERAYLIGSDKIKQLL